MGMSVISCGLTHASFRHVETLDMLAVEIVATLELDNTIRLYKQHDSCLWVIQKVLPAAGCVYFRNYFSSLEVNGAVLVAGGHAADESHGAIHIWHLSDE